VTSPLSLMSGLVPRGASAASGTDASSGSTAEGPEEAEALFARVLAQQIRSALPEEALGGEWGDAFGPLLDEVLAVQLQEKLAASRDPSQWANAPSRPVAGRPPASPHRPPAAQPGAVRVSSAYGRRVHPITGKRSVHHGTDLSAPRGTPIRAGRAGVVVRAGKAGGYGNLVEVDHGGGVTTRYAHCDRLDVRPGDRIEAGQVLATVGSTGRSTGPHLHYEVRIEGRAVDPQEARWNDLFPQLEVDPYRKMSTDHPH